ncbi:MAG: tetratricopeptide repeat protein [Bacteroidales bacterium]|nr:tetratricopeptide repeat protein [Bacteroidales bacterium]
MKNRITLLLAALALVGCRGQREVVQPAAEGRIVREPIHEVTEDRLALDARMIDAMALKHSGRNDEALRAFASITASDPGEAAAWYEQGQLLAVRGWVDSALRCTDRAVALRPDNEWYLLAQARQNQVRGNAEGMINAWERIVALKPNVLEYYYELSNAHIAAGDLQGAVAVLNRVERMVGVSEEVSLQKIKLWEASGKSDKAQRELEALCDALPGERRYQAMLAQVYMQQRKYAKAKLCYDRVLASDPDDEYIHIQLAEYYKQIGNVSEADSEMVRAFANRRLPASTKLQLLGQFYSEEEFYGSRSGVCFRLLEMTIRQSDDPSEYAAFYADVLMRQQRYGEAVDQLELALAKDSSQYVLWEAMLVSLASLPGEDARLEDRAVRASRLFPTHTLPIYLQALCASRQERYADAVALLERASKWGFSNGYLEAECVGLMAEACYRTGQYERAWKHFDRYLKLRPDDWGMMNNYAYYLGESGGQLDDALSMSRRTVEAEPDNASILDTFAWLLHLAGRDAEALPYMERAVAIDPGSDTLQRHLKVIKSKQ